MDRNNFYHGPNTTVRVRIITPATAAATTGCGVFFYPADPDSDVPSVDVFTYARAIMTKDKPVYLTEEGLQDLKEELRFLKTKERARIADAIAEARAKGDISENAEYDAAKEEQGKLEARISKLEDTIARARLVDEKTVDTSKAYILSKVTVENVDSGAEQTYTLVSEQEADISENKISVDSPIGSGLLGKEEGDVIEIDVPAGSVKLKIKDINR